MPAEKFDINVGYRYGDRTVIAVGLNIPRSTGQSFKAVRVKCKCGKEDLIRCSQIRFGREGRSCRKCARDKIPFSSATAQKLSSIQVSKSYRNRPKKGQVLGGIEIVNPLLWMPVSVNSNKRKAACLGKCLSCGTSKIYCLAQLKYTPNKTCMDCYLYRACRRKLLGEGKKLLIKVNLGRAGKSRLLSWAVTQGSIKIGKPATPGVILTSSVIEYLVPQDPNTSCIWPWDDFGNPLSDADLKKAVRKAKMEWKKTHGAKAA